MIPEQSSRYKMPTAADGRRWCCLQFQKPVTIESLGEVVMRPLMLQLPGN